MDRRFYKQVDITAEEGGYCVRLDGRVLPSATRRRLLLPNRALADAIAAEWRAQGERVDPFAMPITRLANTGIDQVAVARPRYVGEIVQLAHTDGLAYWAPEPQELVRRQEAEWQPLLDWFAGEVGAPLTVTCGLVAVPQPPDLADALHHRLQRHCDLALAGLQTLASVSGSAVIALALEARHITAEQAYRAAHLGEIYQAEVWGSDAEAEARRQAIALDMAQTARFLELLQDG